MTTEQILQIEKDYNVKVLYVTQYGSKLYGTDTPESDTDYRGIFLPTYEDRILGNDRDYIKLDTNTSNNANTSDDIDIHLDSIHKWFNLLAKGETGAIDVLFSMWSPSAVWAEHSFRNWVKDNYLSLITSNPKAFCGYAIGQSKKYNIKGARYNELCNFITELNLLSNDTTLEVTSKVSDIGLSLQNYKYIGWKNAPAPRGQEGDWTYLEVLGKLYPPTWTIEFVLSKLEEMKNQYGNRAKKAFDDIDWKALSHAVRVSLEIKELLQTTSIKFPLHDRKLLLDIKQGKVPIDVCINTLEHTIKFVDNLVDATSLSKTVKQEKIDEFILGLYKD